MNTVQYTFRYRCHSLKAIMHVHLCSGFIWILADLHYDPTYLTTQESCNVEISAEHLGTLGDVECDAPWSLIESAVAAMQDINETPDMLFWIG